MNKIAQEAHKRQAVVAMALKKGKSYAARMYGASLSSVKRWVKRYDGTWQSLQERSHRPKSHPARHTGEEEAIIRDLFTPQSDKKIANDGRLCYHIKWCGGFAAIPSNI